MSQRHFLHSLKIEISCYIKVKTLEAVRLKHENCFPHIKEYGKFVAQIKKDAPKKENFSVLSDS